MTDILITASFVAGLVPAVIMLYLYGVKTAWMTTVAGWLLFGMILVTAISFGLSTSVQLWPGVFHATHGEWVRIVVRFVLDAVLWTLLAFFIRTQRMARLQSGQKAGKVAE